MSEIDKYRGSHCVDIDSSDFNEYSCFTTVRVLPEYIGKKVSMGIVSLVKSLGATEVRISGGEITCIGGSRIATIYVDKNDLIKDINIMVSVDVPSSWGQMCGYDFNNRIKNE
jgi:hypothetical protein